MHVRRKMMRRLAAFCVFLIVSILAIGLFCVALDPNQYAGYWYSSNDQCVYLFQDGLIFSVNNAEAFLNEDSFEGAYTYSKDVVFLFVKDIEGLEREKNLYLHHSGDASFLCENKDGSGKIYFMRYNK